MFREILDQRFFELRPVAGDRHRQIGISITSRGSGSRQAVAAVDRVEIQRDPRRPATTP
jgi:hypothetical protein